MIENKKFGTMRQTSNIKNNESEIKYYFPVEKQLTNDEKNHQLTNINVWTPDSQYLVYDTRPNSSSFTGQTIERININSTQKEIIYQSVSGACVGVVTVSPQLPIRYIFIHGPEYPDENWHYDFHHRRGVIITEAYSDQIVTMDALDITPPFTLGALRGGSHVHVFSHDGTRISFTYNDHVMHEYDIRRDQRNVGVAVPLKEVNVIVQHPREYSGSHFCVLVSHTTFQPTPGTDEISRAYEESWVGIAGYRRNSKEYQRWALAFIGDTCSEQGKIVPEIFIVDLPESLTDYAVPGDLPLTGTMTTLPAPPKGIKQRRLTYTAARRYPGVSTEPRHWLRSSPDGSAIAFLMKDDNGVVQLWLVYLQNGQMRQITSGYSSVQSAFSWHPNGSKLAFVMNNCIVICDVNSGEVIPCTQRSENSPSAEAVVFSPDGKKIAYMRNINGYNQLFYVDVQAIC